MQIRSAAIFGLFFLASGAVAKGGRNNSTGTSTKAQCNSIAKLTSITELAANETRLAEKFDNNQTQIDAFKTKAADATQKLTTLTANATLVQECTVIQAHSDAVDSCQSINKLEQRVALAANQTKLESKFDGNATKIAEFQAKASEAATKLATMQSNDTLTQFCAAQADISSCQSISKLQKFIDFSSNTTALEAKFDGNTTKIDNFKAKTAEIQTKLDSLKSNSTLMSTCSSLSQAGTINGNFDSSTPSTPSSPSEKQTSGARSLEASFLISTGVLASMVGIFLL